MKLEKGETYIWKTQVPEGIMKTTFKVTQDNTEPFRLEGNPEPHYMTEIQKVTIDGEDQTEDYIQKAFDGEKTRGIPTHKIEGMNLKVKQ